MFDLKKWPQTCQSFVFHVTWCQSCFVQLNSYQLTKEHSPPPRPPQFKQNLSCSPIIDESSFTSVHFFGRQIFFSCKNSTCKIRVDFSSIFGPHDDEYFAILAVTGYPHSEASQIQIAFIMFGNYRWKLVYDCPVLPLLSILLKNAPESTPLV